MTQLIVLIVLSALGYGAGCIWMGKRLAERAPGQPVDDDIVKQLQRR